MVNGFVGDNDHGDKVLPLSDLLWEEVTKLRQEIVQLNNVIKELKALGEHDNAVAKSYEKIANKYHTTFEKLAQEESTNVNDKR